MIVRAVIHHHLTGSEELSELMQGTDAPMSLRHYELMKYLVAGSVAVSVRPSTLPEETDREASFSVHKTQNIQPS